MKRLEQIREEYAKTRGYKSWDRLNDDCLYDRDLDAIATIYAREVAQASLEKAADNAKIKSEIKHNAHSNYRYGSGTYRETFVDKESITNEQNITLL
ncbi:hypothetical protein KRE40_03680 [Elizabethkingia meningoseptica]|uniref:hypothetical protein n=1 Tax=Elizabethkingia meningoseptica TaxID=238 RepID=UPI0023B17775|nr:hypothetical protein [Elizabethkingia meningoseptica]MDE5507751.1 hypothetical protein [Elizabethkingia meningoseptica]